MERCAAGEGGKFSSDGVDKLIVVQFPGGREDHVAAMKTVAVVVDQLLLIKPAHGLSGAQDGPAQRMPLPEALREQLLHEDVGVVLVNLDFLKNHAPLAFNISWRKDGIQHQVRQHIEGDGHVIGKRLDVEADGLLARECVEVAANRIHFAGNVLRRAGTGSLEEHVLDKVGDAVGLSGFAAGAGLDPDAHGHRVQVFHALGQHD